jgi:hypothetical protein
MFQRLKSLARKTVKAALLLASLPALAAAPPPLQVGDLVFIRVPHKPFREVAAATGSWTNHVGIVVDTEGDEPVVAESTLPFSRQGPLSAFVARSEGRRVAVMRVADGLTPAQQAAVRQAARQRLGVHYDTGFDLGSRGQFCSRFVHEVLLQATGQAVGQGQTFGQLLQQRPDANLGFWRLWFLGRIPWQRQTVTPASVLDSPALVPVDYSSSGRMSKATSSRDTML